MAGKVYGYIAVLKDEKDAPIEERIRALEAQKIDKIHIIIEKIEKKRGRKAVRPRLQRLVSQLRAGDTLTVESIDSLGFSFADISDSMKLLSEKDGVILDILDLPLLHETSKNETYVLLRPFISDLVVQSFLYMGQRQGDIRVIQQRKGFEKALSKGVRAGRHRAALSEDFQAIAQKWASGGITSQEAAEALGFSRSTFFRRAKENGYYYKGAGEERVSNADQDDV